MIIRPATRADLDAVATLSITLYEEHPGPLPMTRAKVAATIDRFTNHPNEGRLFAAWQGDALAGLAIVATHWSNEYGGFAWILDELSVAASHRGQGIGEALCRHVEAEARAFQARCLVLELDDGNRAGRLYKRLGYTSTERSLMRKLL